ncbi:activating signal cointegrator 1 complex subunit 2-like isoform X2 [Antedon mediterranea]|uniref:activating signal cointegrator 1 complex subunit 2-like isoform X2 n=1 Tax=Antedon mediterranea TaxID=105859 RepID=UPI003AF90BB6
MPDNENVALDQKKILIDGTGKQKAALDAYWVDKVDFIKFCPLSGIEDQSSIEEWADRLAFIKDDLQRLLCQPYHKFWSQVIFDGSLQMCLDTYLSFAPRCFDNLSHVPGHYQDSLKHVHKLVFMTFLRIATHKESKEHFITPHIFGDILYENFLFDIPKFMDLCVLYGTGNKQLLSKMINNVFSQQPKYIDDLKDVIHTIFEVFENIGSKCGVPMFEATVSQKMHKQTNILDMAIEDVKDILLYLVDIAQSILAFIEIYSPAADVLYQAGFVNRLAAMYEGVIPQLKRMLKERHWQDKHDSKELVMKKRNDFLDAIESILDEKLLITDLDENFSIEADLQLLQQTDHDDMLDANRVKFILDGVKAARNTLFGNKRISGNSDKVEAVVPQEVTVMNEGAVGGIEDNVNAENESYLKDYAGVPMPTDVEINSMILSIQDLLPDLGDGFIEACLEEFNFDASQVIDKILENSLPEYLKGLDHNIARDVKPKENSLLSQRNNIFDNDDFDIFHKTNVLDKTRIHKGKKKDESTVALLMDKSHVKDMKDRYTELGYTYDNEYDDEYDDTYDTINVGATDADSADELADRRTFTTPRIILQMEGKSTKDRKSEETVEEAPKDPGPPHDEFIANPAVLREKREQRYQQQHQQSSRSKQVKGKPKGQGQDNSTVHARKHKEANKSQRANHNRKTMASRKMAKGM